MVNLMDKNVMFDLIHTRKEELYALLSSLIKINSENFSNYGNEEVCARYVEAFCQNLGLECDVFAPVDLDGFEAHPDYLPGRGLENRYNVVARYPGFQNEDELLLMAHTESL